MDFKTVFPRGEIVEDLYIGISDGMTGNSKSHVCTLRRSLYGLKQASRLKTRASRSTSETPWALCAWMLTKDALSAEFEIKDLGLCTTILGIDVVQEPFQTRINQEAVILRLLDKHGMQDANPAHTSLPVTTKLISTTPDDKLADIKEYQSIVGLLRYLTCVFGPDIAYAASTLGSFNAKPSVVHLSAAKLGITYKHCDSSSLTGYTDANHFHSGSATANIGYICKIAGSAVTWRSK